MSSPALGSICIACCRLHTCLLQGQGTVFGLVVSEHSGNFLAREHAGILQALHTAQHLPSEWYTGSATCSHTHTQGHGDGHGDLNDAQTPVLPKILPVIQARLHPRPAFDGYTHHPLPLRGQARTFFSDVGFLASLGNAHLHGRTGGWQRALRWFHFGSSGPVYSREEGKMERCCGGRMASRNYAYWTRKSEPMPLVHADGGVLSLAGHQRQSWFVVTGGKFQTWGLWVNGVDRVANLPFGRDFALEVCSRCCN